MYVRQPLVTLSTVELPKGAIFEQPVSNRRRRPLGHHSSTLGKPCRVIRPRHGRATRLPPWADRPQSVWPATSRGQLSLSVVLCEARCGDPVGELQARPDSQRTASGRHVRSVATGLQAVDPCASRGSPHVAQTPGCRTASPVPVKEGAWSVVGGCGRILPVAPPRAAAAAVVICSRLVYLLAASGVTTDELAPGMVGVPATCGLTALLDFAGGSSAASALCSLSRNPVGTWSWIPTLGTHAGDAARRRSPARRSARARDQVRVWVLAAG